MKRVLFCLFVLVFSPVLGWAAADTSDATPSVSSRQAVDADHRCAVEYLYRSASSPDASRPALQQAVNHCVTLERGAGAWYFRRTQREGQVSPSSEVLAALERFKTMSVFYLQRAVPRCQQAQADESQCLRLLNL